MWCWHGERLVPGRQPCHRETSHLEDVMKLRSAGRLISSQQIGQEEHQLLLITGTRLVQWAEDLAWRKPARSHELIGESRTVCPGGRRGEKSPSGWRRRLTMAVGVPIHGKVLAELRRLKGMTQEDVGFACEHREGVKVAREEMSLYERGVACPTQVKLNAIVNVLDVAVGSAEWRALIRTPALDGRLNAEHPQMGGRRS